MAIVIAFSSEKGGTGKTTSIEAVATYLHYGTDFTIALFDADSYQASAYKDRGNHLFQFEQLPAKNILKQYYNKFHETKALYPIIKVTAKDFSENLIHYFESTDIIFIDMPGFINEELLAAIIPYSNFVFIPVHPDEKTVPSTVDFARIIKKIKDNKKSNLQDVRLFYSKYSKIKNQKDFISSRKFIEEETDVKFMNVDFYEKAELVSGNLSTVLPYKGSDVEDHFLGNFVQELINIIMLTPNK